MCRGQGGSSFSQGDFRHNDGVSDGGLCEHLHPGASPLWARALHKRTGVQEEVAHICGPRCSRMISLRGGAPARARAAATSSWQTSGLLTLCRPGRSATSMPASRRAWWARALTLLGWHCCQSFFQHGPGPLGGLLGLLGGDFFEFAIQLRGQLSHQSGHHQPAS